MRGGRGLAGTLRLAGTLGLAGALGLPGVLGLVGLVGLVGLAGPAAAQTAGGIPQGAGRLVVVGGGLSRTNEHVYRTILDGRRGDGPFCIIPTAGATPETGMAGPVETFERYAGSGTARGVLISAQRPETARDPEVVAQLRSCSGFFFIGGVQSRISAAFRPDGEATPAYEALLQRWREGAVVSGSSAGAAMMSDPMIAGGSSAGAVQNGVLRRAAGDDDDAGGLAVSAGLGLLPGALVDQHFLARGRIGRLIVAVQELEEYDLGFGIDENTALVVDADSVYTAGASGVIVIDGRDAVHDGRSVRDVRLHLMSAGDRFDVRTRTLLLDRGKSPLPAGAAVTVPEDVFARWAFLHLLHGFAASPEREVTVPIAGGRLVLRKGAVFAARHGVGDGVENTPFGLSITGLLLDLHR